ncbi:hypothetical protein [Foetidibacter luteolus]|uniref:hypothetical protein n=1 Tax=Foetidibacter luteolus TaxID=2608880 RepID=UPI00129A97A8|nr:hypothetical protein [Foetidibacter luteolus]
MAQDTKKSNVHIGFIYPISSNGSKAGEYTNKFSLHAIAGLSKNETGVALAGFSNIIKDSAKGFQAAGFSNHIRNASRGVQLAGFFNHVKNNVQGFQGAGYLNISGSATGVQSAGFANIVKGNAGSLQIAGFLNKSANVNTQIVGFLNIAKKVRGVQVSGFMNIADSSEYPIGIINIIKNGEQTISISVDETLTTLVSFRSGSKKMYGILGIGYNLNYSKQHLYALEMGIGAHFRFSKQLRINTELTGMHLDDFKDGDYFRGSLRIMPAVKMGAIELFAGPTFNYVNISEGKANNLTKHYVWDKTSGNNFYGLYFGFTGGIQVNLKGTKNTSAK